MSTITPKPYYQLNRQTGRWQLVQPQPTDFRNFKSQRNRIEIQSNRNSNYSTVLSVFKNNPDKAFSAQELAKHIQGGINYNSLRYLINCFRKSGIVVKAKERVKAANNKVLFTYQLRQA